MIVERLVFGAVLGWTVLAMLVICGVVGLAGTVESASMDMADALMLACTGVPLVVVTLSPALAAGGAAMAMARMEVLGERQALHLAGVHPLRMVMAAMLAGGVLGGGQLLVSNHVLWQMDAIEQDRRQTPSSDWVWLEDGAYRAVDGIWVGGDMSVQHGATVSLEAVSMARMLQQPRQASVTALRGTDSTMADLERGHRWARMLACAFFAGLAWLPWRANGVYRLGLVLGGALAWQGADAVLYAVSAQGHLTATMGGWSATAWLIVLWTWAVFTCR